MRSVSLRVGCGHEPSLYVRYGGQEHICECEVCSFCSRRVDRREQSGEYELGDMKMRRETVKIRIAFWVFLAFSQIGPRLA